VVGGKAQVVDHDPMGDNHIREVEVEAEAEACGSRALGAHDCVEAVEKEGFDGDGGSANLGGAAHPLGESLGEEDHSC
jgi:hypothetical protein